MKIDWKHLATTEGYKSLKAAYIKSVLRERKWNRSTDELHKTFNKAISRAKQHAHFLGNPLEEVLNVLELKRAERKHNWDSFYSDHHLPKLHSNSLKPRGINGMMKYYRTARYSSSPRSIKYRLAQLITSEVKRTRTKKPKWPLHRKRRRR